MTMDDVFNGDGPEPSAKTPPYPRSLQGPGDRVIVFDDALLEVPLTPDERLVMAAPRWMPSEEACRATIGERFGLADYRPVVRSRNGHTHVYGSTRGPLMMFGYGWRDVVAMMWPAGEGDGWWLALP